jgi:hypothetical protein
MKRACSFDIAKGMDIAGEKAYKKDFIFRMKPATALPLQVFNN